MKYTHKNMLEVLEGSRKAFEHTLEKPGVVEKVKEYGFDTERLKAGLELNRKADDLYRAKKQTQGQKSSKYLEVNGQVKKSYDSFITLRRILRKAYLQEPGIQTELLLNVSMPPSVFGRFKFIKAFFEICREKEDLLAKVGRFGLTPEKIDAALENINKVEKEAIDKSTVMMEDEKATQDRNRALSDLKREWEIYKTVLIAVYGKDNQALEEFGIVVPAEGLFKKKSTKKNTAKKKSGKKTKAAGNTGYPANPGNTANPAGTVNPANRASTANTANNTNTANPVNKE